MNFAVTALEKLIALRESIESDTKEINDMKEPVINEVQEDEEHQIEDESQVKKVFRNTLGRLIRIAEELDNEGKDDASEEIHKIIRKYQKRI